MEDFNIDETLDCRKMSCPMPLLMAKKALKKMKSGQILEILGTDPGTAIDLPVFTKREGHEYLGKREEKEFVRYFICVNKV